MNKKTFYITSPIFYPNANLHIGSAYTMTLCDAIARYHRIIGDQTLFLTGADENTGKVIKSAAEKGHEVGPFLDTIIDNFKSVYASLDISYDQFIRTTDKEVHWPGAIKMWNTLVASGDIYKGSYEGLYCPSCETFYTEKDLIDGKCPLHFTVPEKIKEENYFFKLSKYTEKIKKAIESKEMRILPATRENEILALLERGLEDISFSRPIKNVPHGIPVPGDETQVIYVWCDALVNYISALGYGRDETELKIFWPANVHVIGKDILRFHAAIWPAMLLSAKLELPKNLFVHGFITSGGKKMSKSLGNVIDPNELVNEYGKDAVRYYLLREISPFNDGDLTKENFKDAYNANLANGIGNLTSRILKMAETHLHEPVFMPKVIYPEEWKQAFEDFNVQRAADIVFEEIKAIDSSIQESAPFKLIKTDKEKGMNLIKELVIKLHGVAVLLSPILPETSNNITLAISKNKMPEAPLFLRKE